MSFLPFCIRNGKDDHQTADRAYCRNDDAGHGAGRDKGEGGEQHHEDHDAHGTGFLSGGHAAQSVVISNVFAEPRGQQPLLQSRRAAVEEPGGKQQERGGWQTRDHHAKSAQSHSNQSENNVQVSLH